MKIPKLAGKVCLLAVSLVVCLAALEIGLRVHASWKRGRTVHRSAETGAPLHVLLDTPEVYGLNPDHPEISPQGLRNRKVTVPKPPGVWRILVLGDSVTYGTQVAQEDAYPARLEKLLAERVERVDREERVEVINAGVSGYTPYNELQSYLARGRVLEPDVVVVGFCMNDVANPRRHWDYTGGFIDDVPAAAIPNEAYDRELARRRESIANRSALLGVIARGARRLSGGDGSAGDGGVPTFITGEDALGIEVLVDETSPEWRWLTGMYDQLHAAVTADGAELVVVVFPISYQLPPDYPYLPQENLAAYCRERSIPCVDFLPNFRENPLGGYYLERIDGTRDAWHLSVRGHRLTAQVLAPVLLEMR